MIDKKQANCNFIDYILTKDSILLKGTVQTVQSIPFLMLLQPLADWQYYAGCPACIAMYLYLTGDEVFVLCPVNIDELLRIAIHQREP